jgi:hypothetical protein
MPSTIGTTTPAVVEAGLSGPRPTASQALAPGQATPSSAALPVTTRTTPGTPPRISTTAPAPDEVWPTASQVVGLAQAAALSDSVPGTSSVAPRTPPTIGRTAP